MSKKMVETAAGLSALLATGNYAHAQGSGRIRVGLVGCGGRGTQAAQQAVECAPGMELVALGDMFRDRLDKSAAVLKLQLKDKYKVTEERCFTGFDAYKNVIASSDYVCFATPPGFRPQHFRAAVEAGKHCFIEKPVAVDGAGVRSIIETSEMAKRKGLGVVAGSQYRHMPAYIETIKRIHDGLIGDPLAMQVYFLTSMLWMYPRQASWSDLEWQLRNWYYFTWLSGDHIVEQHVHNMDTMNWTMNAHPVAAVAMGGRQARTDMAYGHIWDHFAVEFEFPNGARVSSYCRQNDGTFSRVADRVVGTKGVAELRGLGQPGRITGESKWRYDGEFPNPYVLEHKALVESVRAGKPINEGKQVAESTLSAILGREAAYTGQEVKWDDVLNSKTVLGPESHSFGDAPTPSVAVPGKTKLERGGMA
jgi:predicted dehydrogenase